MRVNRLSEALALCDSLLSRDPDNADVLFERGKIHWRIGNRAAATCDYAASAGLNPGGPASRALEHARDVESFFNPDIFNP